MSVNEKREKLSDLLSVYHLVTWSDKLKCFFCKSSVQFEQFPFWWGGDHVLINPHTPASTKC